MKKLLLGSIVALALIGAGCSQTPTINSKPAGSTDDQIATVSTTPTVDSNITLTAEAVGNQTVKLTWQTSDELKKTAEGYGLTLGNDPNPTYPGRYWYQRGATFSDFSWTGLPVGKVHLRVCTLRLHTCEVYSNDVEVDIK